MSTNNDRYVLRGEKLKKVYGQRAVVQDTSVEVKQGEIVGLLGPNGAGKTTTFYMITGMIKPDSGKMYEYTAGSSFLRCHESLPPSYPPAASHHARQNPSLSSQRCLLFHEPAHSKTETIRRAY